MSEPNRVNILLAIVDEAIRKDELNKAASALKEASALDAGNPQVKERWDFLRLQETGSHVINLLRTYLANPDDGDQEGLLRSLRRSRLSGKEAHEAVDLLLGSKSSSVPLDSVTSTVLSSSTEAKKYAAEKFVQSATQLFEVIYQHGPLSFDAFSSIPLEKPLWSSESTQTTAQRDLFRLSIAKLIAPGNDQQDRVLKTIARVLSAVADHVAELVDFEIMDAVLVCLDYRKTAALKSRALVASSKLIEATGEKGEQMFIAFIHDRVARSTNDDLIIAFSVAAAMFPVIPAITSRLFLVEGFVQSLVPTLEKNFQSGAAGNRKSRTLEISALELLSAACVDKTCRESIQRYCSPWLENLAAEREGTHKALSALILAKINVDSSADVTSKLESLVLTGDGEAEQAIEGLAYTTLQGKIKNEVCKNKELLQKLVQALKDRPSALFGCLTVFSNITAYRPNRTEEQKKMAQLKSYANSERPPPEDPFDDDSHVTARCEIIMELEIVPALVTSCKQSTSPINIALAVKILLSLAKEQRHRALMAQQGAARLLLQIRDRVAKTDKSTADAAQIEREASHALARILISINPAHVFSSSLPASTAVGALVPLLTLDQESEYRDLLPPFEALLALTNIASMEDNSIRELQIRMVWTQLEDHLLLSSNVLVQRASVELICNLMASPSCVAKFVGDGSKREGTRMQILLALADVEDLATRCAAGGALAMLTEWDAAVSTILGLQDNKGVRTLLTMAVDESDEMRHRGLVCLLNVVTAPGDVGSQGVAKVKESDGVEILKDGLSQTRNGEILQIGVEVMKKLV